MSAKAWIVFIVIVAGSLLSLVVWSKNSTVSIDLGNIDSSNVQPASEASGNIADHVFGNDKSNVVLVEYGDFQCAGCASVYPGLKNLAEIYEDDIAFIFRNFPLTTIHPNAKATSGAAEAAGLQAKFWEMHDVLFENQSQWESIAANERTDLFLGYAKGLGLNEEKFLSDLSSSAVSQKIDFDRVLGAKDNVNSTPSLYLNGIKLDSSVVQDIQVGDGTLLKALIDKEL